MADQNDSFSFFKRALHRRYQGTKTDIEKHARKPTKDDIRAR